MRKRDREREEDGYSLYLLKISPLNSLLFRSFAIFLSSFMSSLLKKERYTSLASRSNDRKENQAFNKVDGRQKTPLAVSSLNHSLLVHVKQSQRALLINQM